MGLKGLLRNSIPPKLFFLSVSVFLLTGGLTVPSGAAAPSFYINGDQSVSIWRVQVSSKTTLEEAQAVQDDLKKNNITNVEIDPPTITRWYRVLAGPYSTKSASNEIAQGIKNLGYKDAYSVTMDISLPKALKLNLTLEDTLYQQLLNDTTFIIKDSTDQVYRQAMYRWGSLANDTIPTAPLGILPDLAAVIRQSPNCDQAMKSPFYIGQIYAAVYFRMKKAKSVDITAEKKYLTASIDAMSDYISKYPEGEYVAFALKQIADCRHASSGYTTPNLQKTADAYQKVLSSYSNSSVAVDAQLQYGGVLFELAVSKQYSWESVRIELEKVISSYPLADRAKHSRARMMCAESYYYQKDYRMMIAKAREMLKDFPDIEQDQIYGSYLVGFGYHKLGQYATATALLADVLSRTTTTSNKDPLVFSAKGSCMSLLAWEYYQF